MLTKQLIAQTAASAGMSKRRTEELFAATVAVINENLMSGKSVQLQGLGQLEIREKKARQIVHPRTGERNIVPAKRQLCFKPAATLKEDIK